MAIAIFSCSLKLDVESSFDVVRDRVCRPRYRLDWERMLSSAFFVAKALGDRRTRHDILNYMLSTGEGGAVLIRARFLLV